MDAVPEGKTIEYKRDFYRLSNLDEKDRVKQHEEMLKDISSFANTLGGDLIIEVEDVDGKPSNVCGFDATTVSPNVNKLTLRIDDLVQKRLEPRVAMLTHCVDISTANTAIADGFATASPGGAIFSSGPADIAVEPPMSGSTELERAKFRSGENSVQLTNRPHGYFEGAVLIAMRVIDLCVVQDRLGRAQPCSSPKGWYW